VSASFNLLSSLRRVRPQRVLGSGVTARVPAADWVEYAAAVGPQLLLDTCVVVDVLQGRSPSALDRLLVTRLCNHSTVVLGELTYLFGRLDPAVATTRQVLEELEGAVGDIPLHRLSAPSARAFAEAGMLAGMAARHHAVDRHDRQALVNDALIFCQAIEQGHVVLTANRHEFALFAEWMPEGRVMFYRPRTPSSPRRMRR
jgi:predicted nucleic acid-binding protein